jgi:hypothetical protein
VGSKAVWCRIDLPGLGHRIDHSNKHADKGGDWPERRSQAYVRL